MSFKRRIAVYTSGRSEYGLLYWTIRRIQNDPDLELLLIVSGSHLSDKFGNSVDQIVADGFPIAKLIPMPLLVDPNGPSHGVHLGKAIGQATSDVSEALRELKPDLVLILGDRFELMSVVTAALPQLIPVAHIHGGESSEGAIDESIRHAVTKLSHLHFAATEVYADRIVQLGEENWRVHVCGAPGLEHIYSTTLTTRERLEKDLGLDLGKDTLIVTYHPETITSDGIDQGIDELLAALEEIDLPLIITYPNPDLGSEDIIQKINVFKNRFDKASVIANLGTSKYLGLLKETKAMVGNSSSGIIEAASFGLPVVNIGDRQKGRIKGVNVVDVNSDRYSIVHGIKRVIDPYFTALCRDVTNPYDFGKSSEVIVKVLKEVDLNQNLLRKRLIDRSTFGR